MAVWSCNILLFLTLCCGFSLGFHKYNMLTLTLKSNYLRDGESRQHVVRDPFTYPSAMLANIDNFNESVHRSWRMEYFINYKHFKLGGPIILQIGGENTNHGIFNDFTEQVARETCGVLVSNQHRYYGMSYLEFPSLEYLSARQSLADIAYLLRHLKSFQVFEKSKVVVIGGSYAGNLAAWMRLLYPDLVDAAYASSAPLLVKADFSEYMQHVSDVFETHCDPDDFQGIKKRFEYYDELLKTRAGLRQLQYEVGECFHNDLHQLINVHSLFYYLVQEFPAVVQRGYQHQFKEHCKTMNHDLNNPRQSSFYTCKGSFQNLVNSFKNLPSYQMSWMYQTCNEFGFYQTLSSKDQIFTQNLPVEFFYAICREIFGPEFGKERVERGVAETNKLYGGINRNLTRVVFVNGDLDPWSRLSVLEDISPEAPARVIHGVTHCKDLHPAYGNPEVIEVQDFAKTMIKKWIGLQ